MSNRLSMAADIHTGPGYESFGARTMERVILERTYVDVTESQENRNAEQRNHWCMCLVSSQRCI